MKKVINLENKKKDSIWDLIKFVILAVVIVMPIRMFIAQPFVVSGESMYPTFKDKEYLIIDEISYRFNKPNRGQVIVFRYPKNPQEFFIKRVIGLPNEIIVIKDNKIKIINEQNPEGFYLDEPYILEDFKTDAIYQTGEAEFFVLGDNRNKSSDSRYWGILPRKLIIGRAYLRLLPIKNISYLPGSINKE